MKCNKCGMDIADNSKFCGYCGASTIETNNLDKTVKIEPISQNSVQPNSTANPEIKKIENVVVQPKNNVVGPKPVNTGMQPQANTILVGQNNVIQSQIPKEVNTVVNPTINNVQVQTNPIKNTDNTNINNPESKNNKLIFIIGGVVLAVLAVVLLVLAFTKSSEGSINVLKKALANLQETSKNSVTANGKVSISSSEGVTLDLRSSLMFQRKLDDKVNWQLKVDKSALSEEINVYGTITNENIIMYLESQIIDLAGMTTSETSIWLHQIFPLDELIEDNDASQTDLSNIIDSEHFIFIEKDGDLNKYQLIFDQELIDTFNFKLNGEEQIIEEDEEQPVLEEPIYIDFYISESNELKKINMDISNQLKDTELNKFVFSVEFTNFNKTVVEIPEEAKKSTIDLQKYMYDYAVDFNTNNNGSFDISY